MLKFLEIQGGKIMKIQANLAEICTIEIPFFTNISETHEIDIDPWPEIAKNLQNISPKASGILITPEKLPKSFIQSLKLSGLEINEKHLLSIKKFPR